VNVCNFTIFKSENSNKMASEGATKAKAAAKPTFLQMAKEALEELAEKSGSSVPRIQAYIVEKYGLEAESVKVHLKPALAKGLENETFVRPKNSEAKGYTGRFKLNKAKQAEEQKKQKEKEKAQKAKEKAKDQSDKKKAAKPAAKKRASSKSKSPKKAAAKTKKSPKKAAAAKSKVKTAASKAKGTTEKPKPAKKQLKTPKKTTKTTAKTPKTPKMSKAT
jgi:histone H1/5